MPPPTARNETVLFGIARPDPGRKGDLLFVAAALLSMVLLIALAFTVPEGGLRPTATAAGSVQTPDGP